MNILSDVIVSYMLKLQQFGSGSRICTGRHLAMLEMNKTLPTLLRRYNFTLLEPHRLLHNSTGFFIIEWNMPMKLELRQHVTKEHNEVSQATKIIRA